MGPPLASGVHPPSPRVSRWNPLGRTYTHAGSTPMKHRPQVMRISRISPVAMPADSGGRKQAQIADSVLGEFFFAGATATAPDPCAGVMVSGVGADTGAGSPGVDMVVCGWGAGGDGGDGRDGRS